MQTVRQPGSGTKTAKGYWRVKVNLRDEYGRAIPKSFERKTLIEAQHAARVFLSKYGRTLESPSGTLRQLFEIVDAAVWSKLGKDHARSRRLYRDRWNELLGDVSVQDLTTPILTRALAAIAEDKSLSTISKARETIKTTLAYAVSDLGWLNSNPALEIRSPKAKKAVMEYPEIDQAEYDRMLQLAEPRVRKIVRLVGECAMRPSEALRVRPEHLFMVSDKWLVKIPVSKTDAGVRSVPVSDDLMREIEREDSWEGITDPLDHIRKWWRKNSKTRFYDLRGWRSDQWRRLGVPEQLRTHLLGHTNVKFTQSVYETINAYDALTMMQGGKEGGKENNSR